MSRYKKIHRILNPRTIWAKGQIWKGAIISVYTLHTLGKQLFQNKTNKVE